MMNRSVFLRRGAVAVAGGLLGGGSPIDGTGAFAAEGAAKLADAAAYWGPGDPAYYHGLKMGMHSYTLRNFQFEDVLKMTKEFGLRYIGLNPKHLALTLAPAKLREAKARIEGEGLRIMGVGVVAFRKADPMARGVFEYAKTMGMRSILASPELEALDTLDPLVEEYGIRIAIHNHGPSDKWPTPDKLLAAIKDHHAGIGACVDWGHYKRAGVEPHEAIRAIGARVYDCHVKDVDVAEEKGKGVVIGTGVINIKEALRALYDVGFQGHAAIEYEADAAAPSEGIRKSLEFVRAKLDELKA